MATEITASSSELPIAVVLLRVEQGRPVLERVGASRAAAERELDHRDDRDREEQSDHPEDHEAGGAGGLGADLGGGRPHRCHRLVRDWSLEYAVITTTITTIIPRARAPATFERPSTVSLIRAPRICSGTICAPWLMSAAAVA
jgi:hypothetical protein